LIFACKKETLRQATKGDGVGIYVDRTTAILCLVTRTKEEIMALS
jgi:hypothetical protein